MISQTTLSRGNICSDQHFCASHCLGPALEVTWALLTDKNHFLVIIFHSKKAKCLSGESYAFWEFKLQKRKEICYGLHICCDLSPLQFWCIVLYCLNLLQYLHVICVKCHDVLVLIKEKTYKWHRVAGWGDVEGCVGLTKSNIKIWLNLYCFPWAQHVNLSNLWV